jgi:HTH-type transcriptional regulator/antitoxin HipB
MKPYNDMEALGQVIRNKRKEMGWTQAHLAQRVGLSRPTVSLLERGTLSDLGVRKLMRLAGVLGLRVSVQPKQGMPTLDDLIRENQGA